MRFWKYDLGRPRRPGFNDAYLGTPPWDIGRPQTEIVHLEEAGEIRGDVLDVGCGTGDNALYLADRGHTVWGIDAARRAIEKARTKAQRRGITVEFLVHDALQLEHLDKSFDTVIDSGLFHSLGDEERSLFEKSLKSAVKSGGTYFMLCFSDKEPPGWGPRRVTNDEIRDTFDTGWRIDYIRQANFDSNLGKPRIYAWLASITRV